MPADSDTGALETYIDYLDYLDYLDDRSEFHAPQRCVEEGILTAIGADGDRTP